MWRTGVRRLAVMRSPTTTVRRRSGACCADAAIPDGLGDAAKAAADLMRGGPRPTSGQEAFDGTTWSVLMRLDEGGSSIFTMHLLEDETCRFSDSELTGSWESERDFVVVEKPKGFFDRTLLFSARLQPPSASTPNATGWRLVEGLVQWANRTDASGKAQKQEGDGNGDEDDVVMLQTLGTFGANEFEEALLTSMQRFKTEPPQAA
jgi:hypothetical protein